MLVHIDEALAAHGLIVRGGLNLDEGEYAPARAMLLVGNAGADWWPHFTRWRAMQPDDFADPLDTWSRTILEKAAHRFDARVLMPNDRPFAPFQQWAMRAEGLKPSPLGILMHPEFGLWHAWRGALLFDREMAFDRPPPPVHPCALCEEKPCLTACPVDAFSGEVFAYETCVAHVRGPDGAICRGQGCLARNACPVGAQWRYPAEVQAFHQKAFARL